LTPRPLKIGASEPLERAHVCIYAIYAIYAIILAYFWTLDIDL
jgi:hypothetical protein